jgi:hypothetical protein
VPLSKFDVVISDGRLERPLVFGLSQHAARILARAYNNEAEKREKKSRAIVTRCVPLVYCSQTVACNN